MRTSNFLTVLLLLSLLAFTAQAQDKVGINNTNPQEALDVNGNVNISTDSDYKVGGNTAVGDNGSSLIIGEGFFNTGIGTTTPHNTAILDLSTTNQGLLVPRMSSFQRTNINSPAQGLLVYDTTENGFFYFDGTTWQNIGSGGGTGNSIAWNLIGNTDTNPGNLSSSLGTDYLGTADATDLAFRTNASEKMRIYNDDFQSHITLGAGYEPAHLEVMNAYDGGDGSDFYINAGNAMQGGNGGNLYLDGGFQSDDPGMINGNVLIALNGGKTGVGTFDPLELLDVGGGIRLDNTFTNNAGTLKWDGTDFFGYDGTTWKSLTTGSSGGSTDWALNGNAGTNPTTDFIGTTDQQELVFRTDNEEKMKIHATGSNGNIISFGDGDDYTVLEVTPNPNTGDGGGLVIAAGDATNGKGGTLQLNGGTDGPINPLFPDTGGYVEMAVNGGHVGIGVFNPTHRLQVGGDGNDIGGQAGNDEVVALIQNNDIGHHAALAVNGISTQDAVIYLSKDTVAEWSIRNDVDGGIGDQFQIRNYFPALPGENPAADFTHFVIDPSGSVGIGNTVDLSYKLDVNSGQVRMKPNLFNTSHDIIFDGSGDEVGSEQTIHPNTANFGYLGTMNNYWYKVYANIYHATDVANYQTFSDRRIKENIQPLESAMSALRKLNGVTYDFTTEHHYRNGKNEKTTEADRKNKIGLIAQDVEVVFPQLVMTNEKTGIKTVGYMGLIPVLVEAAKEQQTIIEGQAATIEQVKSENQQLHAELQRLESEIQQIKAMLKK